MTPHEPEQEPTPIERRLASWRPASVTDARDRMLFEAGRASAHAHAKALGAVWVSSLILLAMVGLGLGSLLLGERSRRHALEAELAAVTAARPPETPQLADRPAPPVDLPPLTLAPSSYFVLTAQLRSGSLDLAMPETPLPDRPGAEPTAPSGSTLRPRSFDRALDF